MTYLLTRPLPKLHVSEKAFASAGLQASIIATSDIGQVTSEAARLGIYLQKAPTPTLFIVTSAYAAECLGKFTPYLSGHTFIAVGKSTARTLREYVSHVASPDNETSEGVLDYLAVQDAKFDEVAIIKGEGGRTTLASALQRAGKTVAVFCVYHRKRLKSPVSTNQWQWSDVKGIIATSGEMAEGLFAQYDKTALTSVPWLTVSERIIPLLREYGVKQVAISKGASDDALIAWIKENWE